MEEKRSRKIVQVSTCPLPSPEDREGTALVVALCEDGTSWMTNDEDMGEPGASTDDATWRRFGPIPKGGDAEE